jgi:hypothetical protein
VTGRGVPDGNMPISMRPDRGDVPQLGDPAFDALLARALRPEDAVASLRPLVESFAALYAAPVHSGPAAEASAMYAFRARAATGREAAAAGPGRRGAAVGPGRRGAAVGPGRRGAAVGPDRRGAAVGPGRHGRRRSGAGRWTRSRLVSIRLGVAAAAVALTAGSAAAAYAGHLPAPVQRLAHVVIGAPPVAQGAPRPEPGNAVTPAAPATAAYGLCQAYERSLAQGDPQQNPVTLRRLASIAGGAGHVKAYCAQLTHPGKPAKGHPAQPTPGQPSGLPTPHANPTPAATHHGKPSTVPTPAATHHGKPTG